MRRTKVLNTLLVLNAVLMALVLLSAVAGQISFASVAQAEPPRQSGGIPDAGEQRNEQIKQLRELNAQMKSFRAELKDMQFQVNVLAMPKDENGER